MFDQHAYTLRQQSRLAIGLSWVAGYVNVVALVSLGVMTSHATGNITHLGQELVDAFDPPVDRRTSLGTAALLAAMLLSFYFGAALSGLLAELMRRRAARSQYVPALLVEAFLLTGFMLSVMSLPLAPGPISLVALTTASAAMGLQNATITRISGAVVRTTHLTGVITDLGLETVSLVGSILERLGRRPPGRVGRITRTLPHNPAARRMLLLVSIIGSFVVGVVVGAVVWRHFPGQAMLLPVTFLLVMVGIDLFDPIGQLREIDPVSLPELRQYGLDRSHLPPGLLIARVLPDRRRRSHAPPHFSLWAEQVPAGDAPVVLWLDEQTRLDDNAAEDLLAAAALLRRRRRRLILAGVSAERFRLIGRHDGGRLLSPADLCPDIEFAVARALELRR